MDCYADRGDTCLCTACYHHVCITILDSTECLTDGVGTGRTCSYHVNALALHAKLNGNISCCHVADHQRNQERVHTARAFVQKLFVLALYGLQASDTGTDAHAHAERIFLTHIKSCILHCLSGCCNCKLAELLHSLGCLRVHVLLRIEILHLCCQLRLIICGIKISDRANADFLFF